MATAAADAPDKLAVEVASLFLPGGAASVTRESFLKKNRGQQAPRFRHPG